MGFHRALLRAAVTVALVGRVDGGGTGASHAARSRGERAEPDPALRSADRQHQSGCAGRRLAGHAADRHRPVRHRHRGPERGAPPHGAARSATSCSPSPASPARASRPARSSRPIIRGLDVNRVRIQENGIGANGASDLGEDHFVPVDPLTTDQVEVIRGPATLRFGSQAIGGVVTTNNRIPSLPCPHARRSPSRRRASARRVS